MITSGQGLVEVPHVEAPAGASELARGAECHQLREVATLPIVFVPGVRSGPAEVEREGIGASDIMRGEEALSLGLAARGHLPGGGLVLSLGSHWKAVHVDDRGRVAFSVSTLAGEMVLALRTHTILASSVPRGWPPALPADWVAAGARRARTDGLPRALYCVRLLDQRTASTPEDRLAFLVGATIAANESALFPVARPESPRVLLAGAPALVEAWATVLREREREPVAIDEDERERAFRAGCRTVLAAGELRLGSEPGWRAPR
jgi:2-dehydro-3-deoxygalactonokinase